MLGASAALTLARPEYGIALVLLLAPEMNLAVGPTSLKFLLYVVAFAVVAYGILLSRQQGQAAPRSLTLGVVVFLLAGVLASAAGIDPGGSIGRLLLVATAVALYLGVLSICREPRQLLVVTAGALGGLLVAGAHGTAQQFFGFQAEFSLVSAGDVLPRVQGSFGHPNELGGYLAVLISLALVILLSRRFSFRLRVLALAGLAFGVPALFYTYARGPVAALAGGLLVWVAARRPGLALPVAAALAAGALVLVPQALEERFEATSAGSGVTLRSDIWRGAISIYSDHPVLGVGLNNFPEAYERLPTDLPGAVQRRLLHTTQVLVPPFAENLYLNVLAEEGIVGLAALLLFLVAAFVTVFRGSRVRDPVGQAVSLGVGAGIVILVLHGIVQVTLFTETALVVFALLAVVGRFVTLDWFGEAEEAQR